ncbi:thioredoxin domain-containing protein [Foetidibacter luteolus]|uniref:thioredoxin domain-containing protein n=1 Tax=Foetidibacter luteolus TaxID=2608880 RepID=UPI00129BF722|nr:thioredoxin domain-containing protein [Foetidibacter luteolus]
MEPGNKTPNALINETSPYLLQHAYNPVEWYPWGREALERSVKEDKPILVSIGYSACHWCHVMERESFEDAATAEIMNRFFINIKIDREERPDLDHIYMDAVQAMTGSGGWPLNVFLTPDKKPFYGGTYFPPVKAFNRMSWRETLYAVNDAYRNRRDEIEQQAGNLTEHLVASNSFGIRKPGEQEDEPLFSSENTNLAAQNILTQGDKTWGGFGRAPKFPQTFSIQYLLQHYYYTKQEASLQQALLSLDKMIQGGIYDHLGGGFARYSTDEKWLAPHFEKMLYDNALLISTLADAYLVTGKKLYAQAISQSVSFIEREMLHPSGGFYSALDADSEGVEGKFYTWSKSEIQEILGGDADIFCEVYNITETGNWEHTNLIWLPVAMEEKAVAMGLPLHELEEKLAVCRKKLLAERDKRIRPGLDDKILLGWNALMITAFAKAYAALQDEKYLAMAEANLHFLENNLQGAEGSWYHSWKDNRPGSPAFLDDYSHLIQAYLQLQEVTGNHDYLYKARQLAETVVSNFSEEDNTFFYFTSLDQQDVLVRKKEVYDGATPSGNAVMAQNLYYLSVIFNLPAWQSRSINMLLSLGKAVVRYPTSFGVWASLLQSVTHGISEVAIVGQDAFTLLRQLNGHYVPSRITLAVTRENNEFALLQAKAAVEGETWMFLCKNYACRQPVGSMEEFLKLVQTPS